MEVPKTPIELLDTMLKSWPEIDDPFTLTHDQIIAKLAIRSFIKTWREIYRRKGEGHVSF